MDADKMVKITLEIDGATAMALAQFVKRVGWSEMRGNAVNDNEAYLIRSAIYTLQNSLEESGYAPR